MDRDWNMEDLNVSLFSLLSLHEAVVSLFIRSVGPTDVPIPAESAIPGQDIPGI